MKTVFSQRNFDALTSVFGCLEVLDKVRQQKEIGGD